jgi:hypothetical protein
LKAVALPGALTVALAVTAAGAQAPQPHPDDVLARVGERVAAFYQRAKNVICIEISNLQPLDSRRAPDGLGRTVESELRLEAGDDSAGGEATVVRKIRKVNGRAPRERDKKDRAACADPNPLSSEPLTFLLQAHRPEYRFSTAGMTKDRNRDALMIDFVSLDRKSDVHLFEDPSGHDDCMGWSGTLASRGRIWVDPHSYDVLRVEQHLRGPVDIEVPALIQRRYHFDSWMLILSDDLYIRYKTVAFTDPDEILLLPESIVSVTLLQGGLQSMRRDQTFSDYKRFVTAGRVLQ